MPYNEHFESGDIAVEYVGANNQNFMFHPLSVKLRGRWSARNIQASSEKGFHNMPDIPGNVIVLNVKKKLLQAVDPLTWQEMHDLRDRANRLLKQTSIGEMAAWPTMKKDALTATEIKSILWILRDFADSGKFVVHQGQIPTRGEIFSMPGKLRLRWQGASAGNDVYASQEELDFFYERILASGEKCEPPQSMAGAVGKSASA